MTKLGWRILQPIAVGLVHLLSLVVGALLVITTVVTTIHDRIRFGK